MQAATAVNCGGHAQVRRIDGADKIGKLAGTADGDGVAIEIDGVRGLQQRRGQNAGDGNGPSARRSSRAHLFKEQAALIGDQIACVSAI